MSRHAVPELTKWDEEHIRVKAIEYCRIHALNYTLGQMNEMAKFAIDMVYERIHQEYPVKEVLPDGSLKLMTRKEEKAWRKMIRSSPEK